MHPQVKSMYIWSGLVVVITLAIALAVPFDDSPAPGKDRTFTRKNGDMAVFWYGRSATPHGRLGSVGNRSFQGGGLHGGK